MAEGKKMDLGRTARQIVDLLEPELATEGFDLLDVRIYQGGGRIQVRIYVDLLAGGEQDGINMKQVARASRSSNMLLEEADLFLGNYIVEVSSPGIRRPLRKPAHFEAAVGEKIEVIMRGKSRRIRGVLTEVDGDSIVLALAGSVTRESDGDDALEAETIDLTINRIYEANLDVDFDAQALINADRRQRKDEKRQKRQEKQTKRRGRPKAPKGPKNESPADGGADHS